jgi:hypothetical protein
MSPESGNGGRRREGVMRTASVRVKLVLTGLMVLLVVCLPIRPLLLARTLEPEFYLPSFVVGCVVRAFVAVLVAGPTVLFPRRDGVLKGKAFVYTTRLVDTST